MAIDWNKVDDVTLALLTLTSFKEGSVTRSWKGHDWDVMNRLHQKGWISDPVSKAKSVVLSDDGVRRGQELFDTYFGGEEKGRATSMTDGSLIDEPPNKGIKQSVEHIGRSQLVPGVRRSPGRDVPSRSR